LNTKNGQLTVFQEQCLCRSITAEPYTADAEYVTVNYNFEFRDSFDRRLKDEGVNGYYDDNGTTKKSYLVDGNGDRVTTPQPLKSGKPIDTTIKVGSGKKTPVAVSVPDHSIPPDGALVENFSKASFLKYRRKKTIAFAGLNL
jgi:hypothetical protein